MSLPPIPPAEFSQCPAGFAPCDEPLVDLLALGDPRITATAEYWNRGVPGATRRCLLRRSAAQRLLRAADCLPAGYGFHIFDAWRPLRVQTALYDEYRAQVVKSAERPLSEAEILARVGLFISIPSPDPTRQPAHTTGGAIDLTVTGPDGADLPMGTGFDAFTDAAATDFLERGGADEARDNRRLLYHCMIEAGFTNLPTEWWHYDYGDRNWSCATGKPAFYGAIAEEARA